MIAPHSPLQNIPRAVRQVFWRILLFYVLAILIIGMLIPYTDPSLPKSDVQPLGATYIGIPIFLPIWAGYRMVRKTRFVRYAGTASTDSGRHRLQLQFRAARYA